jgi:ribosomal protein S6--L-glutamate ligase
VFLLGKPPRSNPLFAEVFARLGHEGIGVEVRLPHEERFDHRMLPAGALAVHRGLRRQVLAELAAFEAAGGRCCNPIAASLLVVDRERLLQALAAAGLPVPRTVRAQDWRAARALAQAGPVVVKALDGLRGRGAGIVLMRTDDRPVAAPFAGPYLVQDRIASDGLDRKLYVAGGQCRGLLKPWPRDPASLMAPFDPDPAQLRLAAQVGTLLGLEIFGIDLVMGPDGPWVVDVNLFPSFRGVADAPASVANRVAQLAIHAHDTSSTADA